MWRVAALLLVLSLAAATLRPATARTHLAIATWNLEWLVSPDTAHAARLACRQGNRATLPCDVARNLARDSADLSRLAWYARQLDADVIAFQEVQDAAIAARIFPDHHLCLARGRGVQHVGFAIRAGVAHRCEGEFGALSLDGAQRPGLTLTLYPGSARSIELLAVHLKSGCADADIGSGSRACELLAAQSRVLGQWIAARAAARFIVLGDFNRGDTHADSDEFWHALAGGDPRSGPFVFANAGVPFGNCHLGAGFMRPIDHILVSRALLPEMLRGSYSKLHYREADALQYRLSDHCPVSFMLKIPAAAASFAD